MQGLRKIFRALAIVILPVIGAAIIFGSSSGMETAVGLGLIIFAFGLIATWFWQPW
jgi:lipopolysaccharide export LptBFGC system permease protein LptF